MGMLISGGMSGLASVQLHTAYSCKTHVSPLSAPYGERSVVHNLLVTGQDLVSLGLDKKTLGLDKVSLGICKHALGTSKYAKNSSTAPRFAVTQSRTLRCPACTAGFQPSDTVMNMCDNPVFKKKSRRSAARTAKAR